MRVLLTGGAGFVGRSSAQLSPEPVPDSAALDPRSVYAATKAPGEQLAAIWSRETAGTVAALRFHNVYGHRMPRDTPYAGVASIFTDSLLRGESSRTVASAATSSMCRMWQLQCSRPFKRGSRLDDAAEHRHTLGDDGRGDGRGVEPDAERARTSGDGPVPARRRTAHRCRLFGCRACARLARRD